MELFTTTKIVAFLCGIIWFLATILNKIVISYVNKILSLNEDRLKKIEDRLKNIENSK